MPEGMMTTTTSHDTAAVEDALAAIARARTKLNQAQDLVADRTRKLHGRMFMLGMEVHSAGQLPDRDLIRRLYWDAPSLSTQAVYEACDLRSPNDVSGITGHRTFELPCRDWQVAGPAIAGARSRR